MEPQNEANYYKRFRVYLRNLKLKEALADLNSAISLKNDYDIAIAQRGKLLLKMGRCSEAEADLMKIQG